MHLLMLTDTTFDVNSVFSNAKKQFFFTVLLISGVKKVIFWLHL